ncbi:hypothetical protein GB937_009558 [Aspergillus fischeri]|nr:hypothetical protein GB937_009558 [Aspergillus fischeri]
MSQEQPSSVSGHTVRLGPPGRAPQHLRAIDEVGQVLQPLSIELFGTRFANTATTDIKTSMLLTAFFISSPFVAIVVNVLQRAQAMSGLSPLKAGLALLPFLPASPFATALSGFLTSNLKIPPFYLILTASSLQLVGVSMSCSYPTSQSEVPPSQYGFEVIMGMGFGLGLITILTFALRSCSGGREAHR